MFFPVVYSVLGVWRESNSYAVPVEFQSDLPPQLAVESVELGEHVRCPERVEPGFRRPSAAEP